MSLSFPIPDWDDDTFSYPDVILNGPYNGKVSVKKKNKSVKRKHEVEGTVKKVQPGNDERPLQAIKKRKKDKIEKIHQEKGGKSVVAPSKDGQKKKKKKEQKDARDGDDSFEIPLNQEKSKSNAAELVQTKTENKSFSQKRKKNRKNKNKYKDLNLKQNAEKMAHNCAESKDHIGNQVKFEQQDSGSIEKNVNIVIQADISNEEVQSRPKKKVKNKVKNKIDLFESKYNNVSQESSTVDEDNDHSPAISVDVKKKKKKKKPTNKSLDSHTLPHNKETQECTLNGGTAQKLEVKKKNKIKGKKMENSMGIEKSGKDDDNDKQDGAVKKKKKKKKEIITENEMSLKVKDTDSPKKAKLEKQKSKGKLLKTEDSEAEEMIFDGNEECSEEFNKDFDVLLSSLNFNQFNSKKKSKKKGSDDGGKSEVVNGRDSLEKEGGGKDDGNTKGVTGRKRKRDSAKADIKDINGRQKKMKTKANNTVAAEEPKTPIRKGTKFNHEKLSKLLEQAASIERAKPSPSLPANPADKLKKKMEDRLMAARFRLVNQELYTQSSTDAKELFKKDPEAFHVYHQGYQAQVRQWPVNPLDLIITWLSKKPKEWVVADMGCGEATLAVKVPQSHVHSLDLVAANARVTACDMAHTPLAAASVDVVVFCLSLMGTNLKDFMIEANRILREGGILKIAEVESRCGDLKEFEKQLSKFGFHCTGRDTSFQYFFLLEFKKNRKLKKMAALPELHLKPCLYKKR